MEACLRLRAFDLTRPINSCVLRICSKRKVHSSCKNSAEIERDAGRHLRLKTERQQTSGLRSKLFATHRLLNLMKRCSSTSLYTPSENAENVPFVLKPELDFDAILREREQFEKSIKARKMTGIDGNISEMISVWKEVCCMKDQKNQMERKRKALNVRSKELRKQKGDSMTKEKIQEEGRRIREAVKSLNSSLNSLMNRLYPLALALPNFLHSSVPVGDDNVVKETFGDRLISSETMKHHPCISTHKPLVHPGYCYTEGELVLKELDLISKAASHLTGHGFTRFSMPDMYKPITMEALGLNVDDMKETYAIQTSESIMHLAGTSPMGFLAYYMMSVLEASDLPHRCFSVGRHYNAANESSEFRGLHHQFQESRVELFGVSEGSEEASNALLSQYLQTLMDLISSFDLPFRIVDVSSRHLLPCMHRMMSLEVWLPSENNYVEVANVCNCTDFISRRLKIRYPTNPRESAKQSRTRSFVHTIHGTALKSSVLLSAMLEHGLLDLKMAES